MKPRRYMSKFIMTNNVRMSTRAIGYYSIILSIILISLISYELYNPLLTTHITDRHPLHVLGGCLIFYFIQLIASAMFMVYGLNRNIRGWLRPWIANWIIVCLIQFISGLWLICKYHAYTDAIFSALNIWIWMCYNLYCLYVVYLMYRDFEILLTPMTEMIYP